MAKRSPSRAWNTPDVIDDAGGRCSSRTPTGSTEAGPTWSATCPVRPLLLPFGWVRKGLFCERPRARLPGPWTGVHCQLYLLPLERLADLDLHGIARQHEQRTVQCAGVTSPRASLMKSSSMP